MRQSWLVILALAVFVGCGAPPAKTSDAPKAGAIDRAEVLATADNADGVADHVVSKCAVCGLGMEGSAAHASSYEGYTFHLCSADCKETFERDPAKVVTRLAKATL
jgi:YHS domain-containing protein